MASHFAACSIQTKNIVWIERKVNGDKVTYRQGDAVLWAAINRRAAS